MTITIDEAIEILKSPKFGTRWPYPPKERQAIRLGIEALKRIKAQRDFGLLGKWTALKGETVEQDAKKEG